MKNYNRDSRECSKMYKRQQCAAQNNSPSLRNHLEVRTSHLHSLHCVNPPSSPTRSITIFSRIFTIAAIGFTTSGFLIPEDQEDGTYAVEYINGRSVHTKIANATVYAPLPEPYTPEPRAGRLVRREGVSCGGARNLDHGNTDAANADIDRQCGDGAYVGGGLTFYAIRGDVVAFYCNFRTGSSDGGSCTASLRQEYSRDITNACGWYNSGWYTYFNNFYSYGYDRGRCFCGQCV